MAWIFINPYDCHYQIVHGHLHIKTSMGCPIKDNFRANRTKNAFF